MDIVKSVFFLELVFILCNVSALEDNITQNTWNLFKKCPRDEFSCSDGYCVNKQKICDGSIDCSDGSDEHEAICVMRTCGNLQFRCDYGACIPVDKVCNNIQDCKDNSDESRKNNCRKHQNCEFNQFECDFDECINKEYVCDGVIDCKNSLDEAPEACEDLVCPTNNYRCNNGQCIPEFKRCNGEYDCGDRSDENTKACSKCDLREPAAVTQNLTNHLEKNHCQIGYIGDISISRLGNKADILIPEYKVRHNEAIFYSCGSGKRLVGNVINYCIDGQWSKKHSSCEDLHDIGSLVIKIIAKKDHVKRKVGYNLDKVKGHLRDVIKNLSEGINKPIDSWGKLVAEYPNMFKDIVDKVTTNMMTNSKCLNANKEVFSKKFPNGYQDIIFFESLLPKMRSLPLQKKTILKQKIFDLLLKNDLPDKLELVKENTLFEYY